MVAIAKFAYVLFVPAVNDLTKFAQCLAKRQFRVKEARRHQRLPSHQVK